MSALWWRRFRNRSKASFGISRCSRCLEVWHQGANWHNTATDWNPLMPLVERTENNSSGGMSILCEDCWQALGTATRRLPFYVRRWELWKEEETRKYGKPCPAGPHHHEDKWGGHGHWGLAFDQLVWAVYHETGEV